MGDRIVVIGGGKSAFDCAAWAAQQGLSPTLLYRRAQWMVPRYLPGGRIPGAVSKRRHSPLGQVSPAALTVLEGFLSEPEHDAELVPSFYRRCVHEDAHLGPALRELDGVAIHGIEVVYKYPKND